jgi:hypothetical protein
VLAANATTAAVRPHFFNMASHSNRARAARLASCSRGEWNVR